MTVEVFDKKDESSAGGNGESVTRFLISRKVRAVITGRCRPETFKTFSDAGIYLYLHQSGVVKEVLEKYRTGQLRRATKPISVTVPA